MDDPSASVLATWSNAFAALGWDVDVLAAAGNDPPLVGNSSAGLRSYQAVLWQVGPNNYPPFSDAQRAAIDSLLNFGGRLLVTGHDIGWGLSDAGSSVLHTGARGVDRERASRPATTSTTSMRTRSRALPAARSRARSRTSIPYFPVRLYPDAGDNVGAAPGNGRRVGGDWTENCIKNEAPRACTGRATPRGARTGSASGAGRSRDWSVMFYEWRALAGSSTANLAARTGVLQNAASWLLGHSPPEVHIDDRRRRAPWSRATICPSGIRSVPTRVAPSPAAGWTTHSTAATSWTPATTAVCADSGCIWDLARRARWRADAELHERDAARSRGGRRLAGAASRRL